MLLREAREHVGEALQERRHDVLRQLRHRIAGLMKVALLERRDRDQAAGGNHWSLLLR